MILRAYFHTNISQKLLQVASMLQDNSLRWSKELDDER